MKFKSQSQRKAVMARLMSKNYSQLKKSGIKLNKNMDFDKDGVKNIRDCKPLDPRKQGIIHDFIKAKEEHVKKKEISLEVEQKQLISKIDNESTKLHEHARIQKKIDKNKQLKDSLNKVKNARFKVSKTGRILAFASRGVKSIGRLTSSGARVVGKVVTSPQAKSLARSTVNSIYDLSKGKKLKPGCRVTRRKRKKLRTINTRKKRKSSSVNLNDIYF